MEWISVKDRLPDKIGFYLVNVEKRVASPQRGTIEIGECFTSVDMKGLFEIRKFHDYVTHWMPLPEPPRAGVVENFAHEPTKEPQTEALNKHNVMESVCPNCGDTGRGKPTIGEPDGEECYCVKGQTAP